MTSDYFWDYGDECPCCGCRHPLLQKDHIVPKGEGGTDGPDNIWYICPNCHSIKTADDIGRASSKFWSSPEASKVRREHTKGFEGRSHSKATRRQISDALKGRSKPEGHGEKVSASLKLYEKTEEHRRHLSESMAKPETRAKLSEKAKAREARRRKAEDELQSKIDELERELGIEKAGNPDANK